MLMAEYPAKIRGKVEPELEPKLNNFVSATFPTLVANPRLGAYSGDPELPVWQYRYYEVPALPASPKEFCRQGEYGIFNV